MVLLTSSVSETVTRYQLMMQDHAYTEAALHDNNDSSTASLQLTTKNGRMFTLSAARLSSQSH